MPSQRARRRIGEHSPHRHSQAPQRDDPLGRQGSDLIEREMVRMNLTINLTFPHPSGNQLGVLGTKIENQNLVEEELCLFIL